MEVKLLICTSTSSSDLSLEEMNAAATSCYSVAVMSLSTVISSENIGLRIKLGSSWRVTHSV